MKKWLFALALLLLAPATASAQCSGVFPNNYMCGNNSGSPNVPSPIPFNVFTSAQIDAVCSTNNDALIRLTGTWQCMSYSTQFSVGSQLSIANLNYNLLTNVPPQIVIATNNLNFYVNGDPSNTHPCGPAGASTCAAGNNSNNCLTPATACLTATVAQEALVANNAFALLYIGNIWFAHSTGTTNYDLACFAPIIGASVYNIVGDSSAGASATIVNDPASGYGLQVKDLCTVDISYLEYNDPNNNAAGHIIIGETGNSGHVDAGNIILGQTAGTKIQAGTGGTFSATGPITSSGNAAIEDYALNGGLIDFGIETVTESGTPAYSVATAVISGGGIINATNTTFSGSATGVKCSILGPVNVGGYDPNIVFPGSSSCVPTDLIGALGIINGNSPNYGTQYAPLQSGGGVPGKDTWGASVLLLSPVTFAQLASPQTLGMIAAINDGNATHCSDSACTAWGAQVTGGGGTIPLYLWYNTAHWTILGK
jgi:hypothetical protein